MTEFRTYRAALIYDQEGNFVGYGILSPSGKLKSINIWTEDEKPDFSQQISALNASVAVTAHWPQLDDPDVQALLDDPNWRPINEGLPDNELATIVQLRTRNALEAVARKRAGLA